MDAIVNHIWQSSIFGAAAAMLAFMFRNNSSSVRYWIWFAAAMKFLVPFAALAAVVNRFPLPRSPQGAGDALAAAAVVFRSAALPPMSVAVSTAVIVVWVSGALAVLAIWVWQWNRLASDARHSAPITDGIVYDTLRRIERAEGVGRPTAIVSSDRAMEPGVLGIWNPVLVWPRHLTAALSDTQIEAIVVHEICHIVRRDNLLAVTPIAASAAFWFYPLVWWIGARLVDERERACDERVLALGQRPVTYAESILKTCELCVASPLVNVAGVTGGDLKRRIVRIMKNAPPAPLGVWKKTVLVLAAVVVVLMPLMGGARSRVAAAPQDADPEVHRPGGRVTSPKLIRETRPQYTPRAMEEKVQGEVLLECVVKADGTVGDMRVTRPLHPDLDQAALDAAAHWLFEPGTRDGKPVNVLVTIAMAFTLKD